MKTEDINQDGCHNSSFLSAIANSQRNHVEDCKATFLAYDCTMYMTTYERDRACLVTHSVINTIAKCPHLFDFPLLRAVKLLFYTHNSGLKDRRNNFLRRKSTTPQSTATEPETTVETTTAKFRRGPSRFKSRADKDKIERQPSLTDARRSETPRRNYLKRRPGDASSTTSTAAPASTQSTLTSLAARRPSRVSTRRRPLNATRNTTTKPEVDTNTTNGDDDFLEDVEDYDYEDHDIRTRIDSKPPKIQRRPLVSLKDEDQNPSATNEEENKRQSKKYSSTFKKNQLDQDLKDRDDEEYTTDKKVVTPIYDEDISAETAVAIAAHQLLSAPIPVIPNYDETTTPPRKSSTSPKTVTEFEFTSPQYRDTFTESKKTFKDDIKPTVVPQGFTKKVSTGPDYSVLALDFNTDPQDTKTTSFAPKTYSTAFTTKLPQTIISEPTITHVGLTGTRYPLKDTEYSTKDNTEYTGPTASDADIPTKFTYPETTFREFSKDTYFSEEVPTDVTGPALKSEVPTNTYPDVPSTSFVPKTSFRSTLQSKPTGFSLPDLSSTLAAQSTFAPRSSRPTNSRLSGSTASSTGRFLGSTPKLIAVPVEDYAFTTNGYIGLSQEPTAFTREYLLESPVTKAYDDEYQYLVPSTRQPPRKIARKKLHRKISTTLKPTTEAFIPVVTTTKPRRVSTVKPFEKVQKTAPNRTYRPILNYDYYDEGSEKFAEKYMEGTKVVVHAKGNIECLDIGNFPHPTSCKKFISCARMESGAIIGWEYVCPKGLSFDPVGGICNWSAGLGCVEKDA